MASQSGPNLDPVYFGGIEVDISQFDFSDHSSRLGAVTITCTVFIALVVLTVALRIFSRARYVRHIFLDDGTCYTKNKRLWLMDNSPHHLRRGLHGRSSGNVHRR